jgi:hypothetical protein
MLRSSVSSTSLEFTTILTYLERFKDIRDKFIYLLTLKENFQLEIQNTFESGSTFA